MLQFIDKFSQLIRGKMNSPLVAKFGGTSMARPELVIPQLELPANNADVVVVSAPGLDAEHPVKTTDMLLDYKAGLTSEEAIRQRFDDILVSTGDETDPACRLIVDQIPNHLLRWTALGDPVEALGEYWSARLFATQTGRQFVDARDIIHFQADGSVNKPETTHAVRSSLGRGGQYVVPGFYGARPDGSIRVFARGGSDITGALIAKALGARQYDNYSDVDGFMTADPRKVPAAHLVGDATYREARELGNGGSELLHREVIKLLGGTGIVTVMKNTFGEPGNSGTEIKDDRDWESRPIIGVTGRDDLNVLNLHEFGLNEGVGEILDVIQELKDAKIPYEHSNDATDDISIYVSHKHQEIIESIAERLRRTGRSFQIGSAGLIHVVGEGLAHSGTRRLEALGSVATALAEADVEGRGATDVGGSATLTLFVKPEDVNKAVGVAHRALGLAA